MIVTFDQVTWKSIGNIYSLSWSDLSPEEEKKISKEIVHFHYTTNIATSKHKNPCPGVMIFINLVDTALVIISKYLYPGVKKFIFFKNTSILHFLPPPPTKYLPLGWGGGHEIYNFCLLTLQMLLTKFG